MVFICSEPYPLNSKYEKYFELYSYPLSDFQKWAIHAIVEGQHVLITAHTGSGKTLPAEFAITHFVGQGQKVIYTSPIKALSNQKYYEFTKKYPHISFGLMTGDIKTNPDADVVIMTTEILVNLQISFPMCVVFDEVHYINDANRGQVWEKAILSLPPHVQMVMLSATIDQPERFAKWCERGQDPASPDYKQVYLASTHHRVVPLSHYGYLTTVESIFKGMKKVDTLEKEIRTSTNKLILLQNATGDFQESGYRTIVKMRKMFEQKQVYMKRKHVLNSLALHLRDHEMLPAIGFVFSRRNVELCAHEITVPLLEDDSKVPYIVARECEQIIRKLPNFQEYLGLPEYRNLVGLLEKGIGIHHSGMIPILREIVELMISKKYIKLLFATESFAIGLDCPIKTAIFTGISKFDGSQERTLLPHEYTQMAGRAGRRGIDTVGHVIHCNNLFDPLFLNDYKELLGGVPQKLVSKFRIDYSLVLNSLLSSNNDSIVADTLIVESVFSLVTDSPKSPKSTDKVDPVVLTKSTDQDKSISQVIDFVNRSMMFGEISKSIESQRKCLNKLESEILEKESKFQESCKLSSSKLNKEKCLKYLDLESKLKTSVNKKRKDVEREMESIRDESKNWLNEIQSVKSILELEENRESEKYQLTYLENYIRSNIEKVLDILLAKGFIQDIDSRQTLTILGKLAINIREIHPLIMPKVIESTHFFQDFSPKQLIGFLSTLVDIKVPNDLKSSIPITDDSFIKTQVNKMAILYQEFQDSESRCGLQTGLDYDDALQYDIIDLVMQWCDCINEQSCKLFIQERLLDKEISTGDFTKAMLKISAISKELTTIAETNGEIEFLAKLAQIDGMILKYIAANQSLYV